MKFSFPLVLNGSVGTTVVPFGQTTVVEVKGNTGNPSFQGSWLPAERTVADKAFTARWSVSFLGHGYPQVWTSDAEMAKTIDASRFGVELIDPVDQYRMAQRSVKYAGLFILLTFATVWLIEVLTGVRVHGIQYLMLGGALCLFFLLELSLSEHLGFTLAYVTACVAVVAMVASFAKVMLRRRSRALVVAGGVTLLYAYLYLLLINEDYALLIGSVGLFAILGAVMYATRHVDWFAGASGGRRSPSRDRAPLAGQRNGDGVGNGNGDGNGLTTDLRGSSVRGFDHAGIQHGSARIAPKGDRVPRARGRSLKCDAKSLRA